ncbi:fibronectin-binding protein PlpA-like [Mytilus edulis]
MNTMLNNADTPVSTANFPATNSIHNSDRKRQLSDQMMNYMYENEGHKKLKCDQNQQESRIESMILQLSSQFSSMSNRLDQRISELETNFEEKVSEKLSEKLSVMIDNKIKDKIIEVKTEIKGELDGMKSKMNDLEKTMTEKVTNKTQEEITKNKFVIKNLKYDEREKTETSLTLHKVQCLIKDCLGLKNVTLKSVVRKESRGQYPGIILAETTSLESKKEIMKNKSKLKHSRSYDKVYIENDIPLETRNFQNTVRTVLKEMGKEKNFRFAGNRLIPKHT